MFKKLLFSLLALFAAAAFAAVDANKADQAALETVKGIGPAISAKIIEERKKSPFKDWSDMVERVKGVGDGNAAKFSEAGLTVNGATFKGAPAKPAAADAKKDEPKADKKAERKDEKKEEPRTARSAASAATVTAAKSEKAASAADVKPAAAAKPTEAKAPATKASEKK